MVVWVCLGVGMEKVEGEQMGLDGESEVGKGGEGQGMEEEGGGKGRRRGHTLTLKPRSC